MLKLSCKRPFERKISFPMPMISSIRDIARPVTWQGFRDELDRVTEKKITGFMYVHVPFCKTLCTYCTYDRVPYDPEEEKQYLHRLMEEIAYYSQKPLVQSVDFMGVHLGGGTPNTLSDEGLVSILTSIKTNFHLGPDAAIHVEIGTKAYTPEKIALFKKLGCNRISFGVQSFDESVRKKCALTTSRDTLYRVAEDLRHMGFDINFDLMYGLPGQDLSVWRKDLKEAMRFNPACLDIYCFNPLHSRLHTACKRGKALLPSETTVLQMIETTIAYLGEQGYRQETFEDFTKPDGKISGVKDIGYGKNELSDDCVYLALGPNAMGRIGNFVYRNKFYNGPRIKNYLNASRTGSPLPLFLLKQLKQGNWLSQRNLAMLPLCLRMKKSRIGDEMLHRFAACLADLEKKGLITSSGDYLEVTDLGKLWIDNLSYALMSDQLRTDLGNAIFSFPLD
jgi:oxygen-independent coproporphyrinogen-3 oxidase